MFAKSLEIKVANPDSLGVKIEVINFCVENYYFLRVFRKRLPERRSGEQRCGRSARKKTGQPRILCQTRSKNLSLISNLLVKLTPKIFELVTNGKTKIWQTCPSMT